MTFSQLVVFQFSEKCNFPPVAGVFCIKMSQMMFAKSNILKDWRVKMQFLNFCKAVHLSTQKS